jgi:hypothetical protein
MYNGTPDCHNCERCHQCRRYFRAWCGHSFCMFCLPCHRKECPTCHAHYYRGVPWGPVCPQASRVANYMLTKHPELDLARATLKTPTTPTPQPTDTK